MGKWESLSIEHTWEVCWQGSRRVEKLGHFDPRGRSLDTSITHQIENPTEACCPG